MILGLGVFILPPMGNRSFKSVQWVKQNREQLLRSAFLIVLLAALTGCLAAVVLPTNTAAKICGVWWGLLLAAYCGCYMAKDAGGLTIPKRWWAVLCISIGLVWVFDAYYFYWYWYVPLSLIVRETPTKFVCAIRLAPALFVIVFIAAIGMQRRVWRRPYFPLFAMPLLSIINFDFDWAFIGRPEEREISPHKFAWVKDVTQDTHAALKEINARMMMEAFQFILTIAVIWMWWAALKIVLQYWSFVDSELRKKNDRISICICSSIWTFSFRLGRYRTGTLAWIT